MSYTIIGLRKSIFPFFSKYYKNCQFAIRTVLFISLSCMVLSNSGQVDLFFYEKTVKLVRWILSIIEKFTRLLFKYSSIYKLFLETNKTK